MLIDTVEGRVTQTKLGIVGKIQMFMCMQGLRKSSRKTEITC